MLFIIVGEALISDVINKLDDSGFPFNCAISIAGTAFKPLLMLLVLPVLFLLCQVKYGCKSNKTFPFEPYKHLLITFVK